MNNHTINLSDCRISDINIVGGKNASLGEMIGKLSTLGVNVPGGFAITANSYKQFISQNNLDKEIYDILDKVDVSNQGQIKLFFSKLFRKHSRLDVVINNAGIYGPIGYFEKNSLKAWKKAFDINFYGCLNVYREAVKIMKKKKYGRIIQIAGGGSTKPLPMFTSYACSKVV